MTHIGNPNQRTGQKDPACQELVIHFNSAEEEKMCSGMNGEDRCDYNTNEKSYNQIRSKGISNK